MHQRPPAYRFNANPFRCCGYKQTHEEGRVRLREEVSAPYISDLKIFCFSKTQPRKRVFWDKRTLLSFVLQKCGQVERFRKNRSFQGWNAGNLENQTIRQVLRKQIFQQRRLKARRLFRRHANSENQISFARYPFLQTKCPRPAGKRILLRAMASERTNIFILTMTESCSGRWFC